MAVTITTEPQGNLLNAYNNSILEFGTDVGTPSRAIILIDSFKFEVAPNKDLFFFDLKEIVAVLLNQDNFTDAIEVLNANNFLFPDGKLYKEIEFSITVFKSNGSSETLTKTYNYIKSAKQIIRTEFEENDLIKILSPSNDIISNVSYFEGYPFDVSIFSNIARAITLTHKRTSAVITLNLSKGVNRLFLSNGENDNLGFESNIPLVVGLNELELKVDASNILTLFVTKKEVDCGVYLKWFNQNGTWNYWKFNEIFKESIKTKSLDEINSDYNNIENSVSRVTQTGKTAQKFLSLISGTLTEEDRLIVEQIFTSPKVFYYNNSQLQPFRKVDWKEIKVTNSSKELRNTKNYNHEYNVDIELPELYTQTYAG
jgi:hypothetical protein